MLNLTIPAAHVAVSRQAVAAGKHVYSEKPLGVDFAEARPLVDEAAARGLRVGCAPDTFLGGSHQTARELIDAGHLGEPVGGTAFFMCPGHERWHPNPDFYYKEGGGPMLDMGPYYITDLVNLLGPVARVAGMAPRRGRRAPITSQPRAGRDDRGRGSDPCRRARSSSSTAPSVTHRQLRRPRPPPPADRGLRHRGQPGRPRSQLVRRRGRVPAKGGEWEQVPMTRPWTEGNSARSALADMAAAIRAGRPHRASGELALHVLEVMEASGAPPRGPFRRHRDAGRAAAAARRRPAARLMTEGETHGKALIVWGGWKGHEPEQGADDGRAPCSPRTAST